MTASIYACATVALGILSALLATVAFAHAGTLNFWTLAGSVIAGPVIGFLITRLIDNAVQGPREEGS